MNEILLFIRNLGSVSDDVFLKFSTCVFQSVLLSPANEAVSVDFRPVRLPPDMMRFTTVAQITFKGKPTSLEFH